MIEKNNDILVKENSTDADEAIKEAKLGVLKQFVADCLEIRDKDNWKEEHSFTIYEIIEIAVKLGVREHFIENETNFSFIDEQKNENEEGVEDIEM